MTSTTEQKLSSLGLTLPDVTPPVANYVPYVISGNLVYISGQICMWEGSLKYTGKLGKDLSVEEGKQAAHICALNVLAQLKHAAKGNLDHVSRCIKLGIFINSTDDFTDQPNVANGASDLMVNVFGDKGKHARAAVSSNSLPLGTAVEVDAVFEL